MEEIFFVLFFEELNTRKILLRFSNIGRWNFITELTPTSTVTQPGSQLTRNCVEKCVQTVIDTHFKPFIGKLTMGDEFNCPVTLCPPPVKFKKVKEFEKVEAEIEEVLDIKGFLTLADVASPPVVSR